LHDGAEGDGRRTQPGGAQQLLPSLGSYSEGAGCVYVKRLADVDQAVLRELVAIAFARPDDD